MRWNRGRRSRNLEDRRFQTGRGRAVKGTGLGLGGLLILLALSMWTGQDFLSFAGGGGSLGPTASQGGQPPSGTASPEEEELVDFVSAVLDSVQVAWTGLLPQVGRDYQAANLVLFRDHVESACGFAQSATGPFYCPGDQKVYIDLSFYDDLRTRFGAPGDFAQAYVLAHEIGHHVQTLLGIERQVREMQQAQPADAEPVVRGHGAPSRLPGRCLGEYRSSEGHVGTRRHRGGAQGRCRHRRRPDSAASHGTCDSGFVHPRFLGAEDVLVAPWPGDRGPRPL